MKAMILAAGRGERMRPLTDKVPKPLLRVGNRALIEHVIEALARAGYADLVINHAYLGASIEQALGDGSRFGVTIRYSAEADGPLETGGGIFRALPLLGERFVVVNSDIWTDYPFDRLKGHPARLAHLVLVDNPPHHLRGDFGLDGSLVKEEDDSKYTFAGIGVYRASLFKSCEPGRFPLVQVLRSAIRTGAVTGERYTGRWMDVGTPERLHELHRLLAAEG